ncbi:hypothetical protein N7G274_006512 [Stereocaulon virgatum]|uniref:Uncharacterized protein n=1 Tax=Stereocaulon virgatum TaxID=373712 RepID=A0ABR4A643_9LECA
MPLKQPVSLIDRAVASCVRSPFVCPSCRFREAYSIKASPNWIRVFSKPRVQNVDFRSASTTASVTAVNAKREIPHVFRRLHASLKALETVAGVYVNTSQLRLALRGTESEDAITRVAGKNSMQCCQFDLRADVRDSPRTQSSIRST